VTIGATEIRNVVPKEHLQDIIEAYNYALVKGPFLAGVICASFAIIGALGMEWRSTKEKMQKKAPVKEDVEKGGAEEKLQEAPVKADVEKDGAEEKAE
jgi:hypothetical protein